MSPAQVKCPYCKGRSLIDTDLLDEGDQEIVFNCSECDLKIGCHICLEIEPAYKVEEK